MHCIHRGIKFKSRGKGERQTSTMDCDAHIKLLTSKDGQALEITSLTLKHDNHDLSPRLVAQNISISNSSLVTRIVTFSARSRNHYSSKTMLLLKTTQLVDTRLLTGTESSRQLRKVVSAVLGNR